MPEYFPQEVRRLGAETEYSRSIPKVFPEKAILEAIGHDGVRTLPPKPAPKKIRLSYKYRPSKNDLALFIQFSHTYIVSISDSVVPLNRHSD